MNPKLITLGIIVLALGIGICLFLANAESDIKTEQPQYLYLGNICDVSVHEDVPFAICYKEGEIVETIQRGNLYEASVTPEWNYDYVEVYSSMKKEKPLISYTGQMYFDIKGRCA